MEYIQLLAKTCSNDISSCCGDYGIATFLYVMKRALNLIHIVAPAILILMAGVSFLRMVVSPDDQNKAKSKSIMNKFISAVIVFFTPFIIDLLMSVVPDSFEIVGCWNAADDTVTIMNETEDYEAITSRYGLTDYSSDYGATNGKAKTETGSGKLKGTLAQKRAKVVDYAMKFNGNDYVYGGTWNGEKPYVATDCSGFVQGIYRHFGYSLPRTSTAQAASNQYERINATKNNLKKGDLIFYYNGSRIGHVAMYIGNGQVIHASNSRDGIKVSSYNYRTPAWARRIIS